LGGWILKVIWDMLREMRAEIQARDTRIQDDLKKLDTKMHEDFVRRDDFKDAVREIKDDMKAGFASVDATLRLIFKKLDSKD
jgi:molybdenum cofactor biosynthesis enzyme MoaA